MRLFLLFCMGNLTQIFKEDFKTLGQVLRGIAKGTIQGSYTPLLMSTGTRQFAKEVEDGESGEEFIARGVGQIASACVMHTPIAMYAVEKGRGLEYFGALALTNAADYLVHAHKRAKE